ncbi:MAG TPA: LapA family protein [Patescibacteria group bacterium]
MLALFILIIFGLGLAYFATQNTGIVHILFGSYVLAGVPLYLIVIGSMLFGIFVSWLISMVDSVSSFMVLYGKDAALKRSQSVIDKLKKENAALSKELEDLKEEVTDENKAIKDEFTKQNSDFLQHIHQSIA